MNFTESASSTSSDAGEIEFPHFAESLELSDRVRFNKAISSYLKNRENEFSMERDVNHILGEENIFRYLPLNNCVFRILPGDKLCDVLLVISAASLAHTPLTISIDPFHPLLPALKEMIVDENLIVETEEEFLNDLELFERIRTCSPELSDRFYNKAAETGKYIAASPPLMEGRIELLHYLKEQSIACEYHRYGSIWE